MSPSSGEASNTSVHCRLEDTISAALDATFVMHYSHDGSGSAWLNQMQYWFVFELLLAQSGGIFEATAVNVIGPRWIRTTASGYRTGRDWEHQRQRAAVGRNHESREAPGCRWSPRARRQNESMCVYFNMRARAVTPGSRVSFHTT